MKELISVILPVYNQEKYLAETIQSVLSQTYGDFEFLILDDGSTDGSAKIIRDFAQKDRRIKTFFEPNARRSNATNKLVHKAIGKWCAFLDADDIMIPYRLEKQLNFHLENPEIDATSCHCFYINENGFVLKKQRHPYLKNVEDSKKVRIEKKIIQCAFTGLMTSKKSFLEAGGLKKQYDPCDDFEFFNRFIDKGFTLVIIQEILMKYRIHPGAITAKKPLFVYDKLDYTYECIRRRRNGQREITFEEFLVSEEKEIFFKKLNKKRFHYSQFYFRRAGYFIMSKKYFLGSIQLLVAFTLSPYYILSRVINLTKPN